ncbi:hypothetical protein BKA83DRAFT_2709860 [Pisolithus microcarpus]|nr:hypothetical protein BKA83DRAFT_2709860 [Pisolithus microcarpus]
MLSIRLMVTSILRPCVCWFSCVHHLALSRWSCSPCYVSLSSAIDSGPTTFLTDIAALLPVPVLFGLSTRMPVDASRHLRYLRLIHLCFSLVIPPFIISHCIPYQQTAHVRTFEFRFSLSSSDRFPRVAIVIAAFFPYLHHYFRIALAGGFLLLYASFMACDICI